MPTVTQFTSVDMIPAMEALAPPESFLNATFFPRTSFFAGRFCQVDFRRARRWLAPVVKRNQIGRVVARPPLETRFYEVPEVRGVRETAVADLDDRLLGESAYAKRTGAERLADLVAQDILDLVGATTRRIEKMTSDLLFTGAISYLLDDGSTETLSYGTVTPIVPSVLWDATSGSDPIKDLSNAANTIIANSGIVPDVCVMGSDALSVFLNNAVVAEQLNKLHLVVGGISPTAPQGVGSAQLIGRLFRPYVSVFGYSEAYETEDTNVLKPMISPKAVLLGSSKSPATTSYGAVTQTEQDGSIQTYADLKYVPRQLSVPKEDRTELRIASRPCLIPFDLASWAVIAPLTGGIALATADEHDPVAHGASAGTSSYHKEKK
jgi:major capsid protein E